MVRPAPYKHRIVNAILELNEYRGSSLKSIETAVIQGHVGISNLVYIKNALKKGVATGDFIKVVDAISKYKLSPKLFAQAMVRSKKSHSQSQKSIKDEEGVEESDFRAYLLGLTMHDLCYKTTAKKVFFLDDSDLSTLPSTATDNPHNGGGATLYEKADVVDLVVQQYGERDAWDEMMARKQESKAMKQKSKAIRKKNEKNNRKRIQKKRREKLKKALELRNEHLEFRNDSHWQSEYLKSGNKGDLEKAVDVAELMWFLYKITNYHRLQKSYFANAHNSIWNGCLIVQGGKYIATNHCMGEWAREKARCQALRNHADHPQFPSNPLCLGDTYWKDNME
jgi:hypothetical protein